jgi:hypothetical protein
MQKAVQDVLNAGVKPMYQWLLEGAREQPRSIVIDGDVAANPVACYVAGALGPDRRGFLQVVAAIHLPDTDRMVPPIACLRNMLGMPCYLMTSTSSS